MSAIRRRHLYALTPLLYSESDFWQTLTGDSEIRARWAGYLEDLYPVDPTTVIFPGMLTPSGMRPPCKL